jgi:hypothetical protein
MKIITTLVTSVSLTAALAALAPHLAHADDKPTKTEQKRPKPTAKNNDKTSKNDGANADDKSTKSDAADKNAVDIEIDRELYKNDTPKNAPKRAPRSERAKSDDSKSEDAKIDDSKSDKNDASKSDSDRSDADKSDAKIDVRVSDKVDADKADVKEKEKGSLGPQGAMYTAASVSTSPYVLFGYFPAKDFTIAAGAGVSINGNGGATSPLTELKGNSNANVAADLVLAAMYFVVDKHPFATGPEVVVIGSMAPGSPFDTTVVEPMWGFRYAPWAAPIAIGTDVGVSIAMAHGAKPVAGLTTSGLDIVFAF